jgi:4-aminobutyrate aminotransferase
MSATNLKAASAETCDEYASAPCLKTPLPGPNTRALVERDAKFVSPSYTRSYPLAAVRGRGAVVQDPDGNLFLDFSAGIATVSTGHCHPEVVATIQKSAAELIHMSGTDFYYPAQVNLAQKLAEIAPGDAPRKVFFGNSGAEANEAALKLARWSTKRGQFLAFVGAFHGRTLGALSLTASRSIQRAGFFPTMPGVTHVMYPNPYRPPMGSTAETAVDAVLDHIENVIFRNLVSPDDIAGVFVEAVQGEGGYVVPPMDFLPRLHTLLKKHGILLIADEVQCGMGRTGKMFAVNHSGVIPDIITSAKGIASGMPLGAMIANADRMTWPPGAHASTFGGNPVACAAALTTIDLLQNGIIANAGVRGEQMMKRLKPLVQSSAVVGDVRGLGLMIGVEIVSDKAKKTAAPALRDEIIQRCFEKGLLILGAGPTTVRFCPPLVINEREAAKACDIFMEALQETEKARKI